MQIDQQAMDLLTALQEAADKHSADMTAEALATKAAEDANGALQTTKQAAVASRQAEDGALQSVVTYLQGKYGDQIAPAIGALRQKFADRRRAPKGAAYLNLGGLARLIPAIVQVLQIISQILAAQGTAAGAGEPAPVPARGKPKP